MNTITVVFAFAWPVIFFTSLAEAGAGTAALAATIVAIVFAGGVEATFEYGRRR